MSINAERHHICVCICTFKRVEYLKNLLQNLTDQETCGFFTYSIVVVDNDELESARTAVSEFAASSRVPVQYFVQPLQNIALARNKAVGNARGDFIAFIDDDEFPIRTWLLSLFESCQKYGADGVLGPVKPHFDKGAPKWVIEGKFYERPDYLTGYVIDGADGRTGNLLFRRGILPLGEEAFQPQFKGGSDQDFFRRMIEKGHVFLWCSEAVAYEVVPPARWTRSFILRKALFKGGFARLQLSFGAHDIIKSVIAVPAYTVALPFALALGQHRFMRLLARLCWHLGNLLSLAGIQPLKKAYITE